MIAVQMLKHFEFVENERGDYRRLHAGWTGQLDDEAAIGVIAAGAARPLQDLAADQAQYVDLISRARQGDKAAYDALIVAMEGSKPSGGA